MASIGFLFFYAPKQTGKGFFGYFGKEQEGERKEWERMNGR